MLLSHVGGVGRLHHAALGGVAAVEVVEDDVHVAGIFHGAWDVASFMDPETFPYNWDLCYYPTLSSGKSVTWSDTVVSLPLR